MLRQASEQGKDIRDKDIGGLIMKDVMIQDGGALTISESDRIRIAAALEALSVNSRR